MTVAHAKHSIRPSAASLLKATLEELFKSQARGARPCVPPLFPALRIACRRALAPLSPLAPFVPFQPARAAAAFAEHRAAFKALKAKEDAVAGTHACGVAGVLAEGAPPRERASLLL